MPPVRENALAGREKIFRSIGNGIAPDNSVRMKSA
jgi:hypothetical protein